MLHRSLGPCIIIWAITGLCGETAIAAPPAAAPHANVIGTRLFKSPLPVPQQDDPESDGWDTEVFSNLANAQLKQLGTCLQDSGKINANDLRPFIAPHFSCGPLRPSALQRAYSDGSITVERRDPSAHPPTLDHHRGVEGAVEALLDLAGPFATSTGVLVQFKLFHVEQGAAFTTTRQYFSMSGRFGNGSIEQIAIWECQWTTTVDGAAPQILSIAVNEFEQSRVRNPHGPTLFADCTESVLAQNSCFKAQIMRGIFDWVGHIEYSAGIGISGHLGLAVGDVNGDALEDVYLCQTGGLPNRLFIQNSDGTATDRSAWAGVDWYDRTTSALLVDLDNDGDQDLVLGTNSAVLIMENDGTGRFQLRSQISDVKFASGLAAADYDLDGYLDVYVCRYNPLTVDSDEIPNPIPYYDANNGADNVLLRQTRRWEFTDATIASGLDADNTRWTYAAAWDDYDNDGDVDLYVANDYGRNCLYRNDGGDFRNVAPEAGVEDVAAGMSVSWGDYNRDGLMDLYIGNMFSAAGSRITFQRKFQPGMSQTARAQVRHLVRGNTLFSNLGDGTFADVSVDAGVTMGRWSWSSIFMDINNDGWEDLVVANGYLTAPDTGDL